MGFTLIEEETPTGPLGPPSPTVDPVEQAANEYNAMLKDRAISGAGWAASLLVPKAIKPLMAGSRFVGPLLARPAANVAAQAAIGSGESALKGEDPTMGAVKSGGTQAALEALSNIFRIGKMVKGGMATQAAYAEAEAARKAATEASKTEAESGFLRAKTEWSERQAAGLAEEYKKKVPAWSDYPSTTEGLYKMVKGDGPQRASKAFDETMQAIGEAAKGAPPIKVRTKDAKKLGLENVAPASRQFLFVDPAELANKAVGFWKKDPGVYRRVTEALDAAGLGDPAARGAYKSAMALVESVDKARLLEGGQFHPERIIPAMEKSNKYLDITRKRGEGDIFTGPLQAAGRGEPSPPPEIPPFTPGPKVSPDVTMMNKPAHLPWILGAMGGGAGYAMGPGGHTAGSLLGMGTGAGLGMAMPPKIPFGNLPPDFLSASGLDLPTLIQTYLRQQMGQ